MKNDRPHGEGQGGFTLIEALVVMIVGIVILAAAAAGIGKLFHASEISTEANHITQITANVKNLRGPKGYQGLTNEMAVKYKAIPADMAVSADGKSIFNSWKGAVTVAASGDRAFSITYDGVPPEACQQLVLKLRTGTLLNRAFWETLKVGGVRIYSTSSLTTIGGACKAENNSIEFLSVS
jgi:type II secretory pathway pseudopilin PulG